MHNLRLSRPHRPALTVARARAALWRMLLLTAPNAVEAQQPASAPGDSARRPAQTLMPVVSTAPRRGYRIADARSATRLPLAVRDVPQAVSAVTRALLDDQATNSMAEAARWLPSVTFAQGEGHRDAATIRGNASTSVFFVDGVRDDAQYFRDLYATERVEALKGPSALMFGRGVGGGVLNRVLKTADFVPRREVSLQGGSYGARRAALDAGDGLSARIALRLSAVYENTDLFRQDVGLTRWGVRPVATLALGAGTTITAAIEQFRDARTVDRGIPSFAGRPSAADRRTFFGDPAASRARTDVQMGVVGLEHGLGAVQLRSRMQVAAYDKFYRNVYPGAVSSDGGSVNLAAYDNAADRLNLLHQTDIAIPARTGGVLHRLVAGIDLGRQTTTNRRNTGYFGGTATTLAVPFADPRPSVPVAFRPSATDADNRGLLRTAGLFVQDYAALTPWMQVLAGLRLERFDLTFDNRRTGERLRRADDLVSPRVGLIVAPARPLSVYAAYSVAQLPSAGDQFASLTATTVTLRPERFTNAELGIKADLRDGIALSAAAYQLDRTNTSAPSPQDPAILVQTGRQRTRGVEADLVGTVSTGWQVVAGYAFQDARIVERTTAAIAGARVPIVPRHQASLWQRIAVKQSVALGVGLIHQSSLFAAIDNTVILPAWTRVDAAVYLPLGPRVRAQLNVENLFDRRYFPTANGNDNISPGSPRLLRATMTTRF